VYQELQKTIDPKDMTELSEKHKYDNQPLEHHVTHLKNLVTSLELYIGEDDNYRFVNAVKAAN